MKNFSTKSAVLLVVGILAGIVGVQLLPLVAAPPAGSGPAWKLEAALPSIEKELNTYRNVPADTSAGRLNKLSSAFGMTGKAAGADVLSLDQGGKSFRLIPTTGAMMFRNGDTAGKSQGNNLLGAGPAGAAADKLVNDNDLLPKGSSRNAEVILLRGSNGPGGQGSSTPTEVVVNYSFKLQGKAVEGPGAKAMVALGDGGEVTTFIRTMPDVAPIKAVGTKTAQQALTELQGRGYGNMLKAGGGPPKEVHIKGVRAAFWVEDPGRGAGVIEPCFIFTGTATDADGREVEFMQKITAVAGQTEPAQAASPTQPPRQ
jgi:hypothetical protein